MAFNVYGPFKYSTRSLSLREFLNEHEKQLPQLLIVSSGLYGTDDLHTFAQDEIFRIDNIDAQQRIIFSDDKGRKLSFPSNYHLKFQTVDAKGKVGKAKKLMEIIGKTKKLSKLKIQVEENSEAEFYLNNDSKRTNPLGILKYEDTYDEKYLIGFSVIEGKLSIKPIVMPVYVGIYVATITGFAKPSSLDMEDYLKTMSSTMAENLKERKLNEKIFILPDDQPESDYAYISPSAILNLRVAAGDGRYDGLIEETREDPIYEDISQILRPQLFKKPIVPVKPQVAEKKTETDSTYATADEKSMQSGPLKEVINSLKALNVTRELPKPPPEPSKVESLEDTGTNESVVVMEENPYGGLPIYRSLSEVPLDISKLSKYRIADCLRLLNLQKYSNKFILESVDGGLVSSLNNSILQKEFKFTHFQAAKFMRFVNGWRPVEEDNLTK